MKELGAWKKTVTPRREGDQGKKLNKAAGLTRNGREQDRWEEIYCVPNGIEFYPRIAKVSRKVWRAD
jgi:hypothetical protein